jgi:hypothetical protein
LPLVQKFQKYTKPEALWIRRERGEEGEDEEGRI